MSTPQAFTDAQIPTEPTEEETNAAYEDALDDVHTRFLLNLPPEELSTSDRIFFQLEQAWWFYDDFYCDHSKFALPRFKNVRSFAIKMFEYSPLLQPLQQDFDKMWSEFSAYKRKISTYGAILLNQACTKIVLCQVWKSDTWTMPAGKINENEHGIDAAARETYEETGFDPNCISGLTKQMKEQSKNGLPWKPLRAEDGLVFMDAGKRRTCYVCRGVPDTFPFEPVCRKEVEGVEWHDIDNLPKKSFAVLPFMKQLRRWIKQNNPRSQTPGKRSQTPGKKKKRNETPGRKRSGSTGSKRPSSRHSSRGKVRENDPLTETGLASPGETDGWTEDDMFKANEKLLGRKITYDGNPHLFAQEKGFDPHAFHVVGGSFMNSGVTSLAPAPQQSKLQPLFRRDDAPDEEEGLKPFFSDDGETPWGEMVATVLQEEAAAAEKSKGKKNKSKQELSAIADDAGQALLNVLQGSTGEEQAFAKPPSAEDLGVFMTDADITAKSQKEKGDAPRKENGMTRPERNQKGKYSSSSENAKYVQEWVKNLPKAPATERFGEFHFDVDSIMDAMNVKG